MEGKTTRLIERAIEALGNLKEDQKVYITGPHSQWLNKLECEFKEVGLVDVVFITISQISNGYLRGRKGILLIDDFHECFSFDQKMLIEEESYLKVF